MNVILIITKQERNNPHIMIWKNILLEMVMMILKLCINSKVVFDMVIESVTRNNKLDMIKQWTK